ncbi:MAG: pyruvate kinase [bacterium]
MRKIQIVATLGPASYGEVVIRRMMQAGVNVFRFNLSHVRSEDDYPFLAGVIALIRRMAAVLRKVVDIMVDCPGHKLRLGEFVGREVSVGDLIELTTNLSPENGEIPFPYERFLTLLRVGQEVLIGDGCPIFEVVRESSLEHSNVLCRVTMAGLLEPRKGFTVRGFKIADLDLPHLTQKDERGVRFAVEVAADQIVMSYGTTAVQVAAFKEYYLSLGGSGKILFKYELGEAGEDLAAIVSITDGGFVGLGDLRLSVRPEHIVSEVEKVVRAYRAQGKSCIVGTGLLASMKKSAIQSSEQEVLWISYLISLCVTGLMVSDETSVGFYPVEVIETLDRLIRAAEVVA